MKNKIKQNKRTILVINAVLAVYILVLSIGYAIFGETLKISGTAGTDNPDLKVCPFEMQEISSLIGDTFQFKRYFAEYQDLSDFMIDNANNTNIYVTDSYDKRNNTYNFFTKNSFLFPNDPVNTYYGTYKTVSKPMYMIFKNTTAYSFDQFNITLDLENEPPSLSRGQSIRNLDIRTTVITDPNIIVDTVTEDANTIEDYWVNSTNSVFENYVNSIGTDPFNGLPFYSYDDLYSDAGVYTFDSVTVNPGEYLVVGIKFPEVSEAIISSYGGKFASVGSGFGDGTIVAAEFDWVGVSFKFWPTIFEEESAFHVRMAFVDQVTHLSYFLQFGSNSIEDWYVDPTILPYPVDWWPQ